MILVGLLLYLVLIFIRPGDWVGAVLNWPLEFVLMSIVGSVVFLQVGFSGKRIRVPQSPWVLGWLLAVLLSCLLNWHFADAGEYLSIVGKRAVLFFIFLYWINSVKRLKWVLLTIVFLSALLGLQGIYQIQNDGIGWAGHALYWGGRIRWIGYWDGANVLSFLFVITVPFILEFIFGSWGLLTRLFGVASGALVLTGLYLAQSRGGWVALFVVLLFFFKKRIGNAGLLVGSGVIVLLFLLGPSRIHDVDIGGQSANAKAGRGRVDMWAEGLEMLRYNPIFGIGKGEFRNYTKTLVAHNAFVQNMGETGLFGLFFWIGMIYFSFKSLALAMKMESLPPGLVSLGRAIHISLVGYLAAAFFITAEESELLYILVALAGSTWVIARRAARPEASFPLTWFDMKNIALIEIAGVVGMYLVTRTLSAIA